MIEKKWAIEEATEWVCKRVYINLLRIEILRVELYHAFFSSNHVRIFHDRVGVGLLYVLLKKKEVRKKATQSYSES